MQCPVANPTEIGRDMRRRTSRWRWLLWTIVGIVVLGFCWVGWHVARAYAYTKEAERSFNALFITLREKRPQHISQDEWNLGVYWAVNAHTNVFIGEHGASFQSMKRFGDQLDDKLKAELDITIFDWIWDQLEQAGAAGKRYVRFRQVYREDLQAIRERQLMNAPCGEKVSGLSGPFILHGYKK